MIYLILDTNIWIYMANGFNSINDSEYNPYSTAHFELYEKLKQKVEDNEITIVTNYIIISEWKRNRIQAEKNIKEIEKIKKQKLSDLISQKKDLGYDSFKIKHIEISNTYNKLIDLNSIHIHNIDNFIKSCLEIPVSDIIKLEIANLAIDKNKVPFLTNKNNFPDAAILFSAVNYLKENMKPLSYAVFVSNNYKEFGKSSNSSDFHNDLKSYFKGVNIEYHRHLNNLLDLTDDLQHSIEVYYEHLKDQEYYFNCLSPYCEIDDNYGSFGYLTNEIYVSKKIEEIDINQLYLFEDLKVYKSKYIENVFSGKCVSCQTNHVQCPICNSLLIDINGDDHYWCNDCDQGFQIIYSVRHKNRIIYNLNENEFHS